MAVLTRIETPVGNIIASSDGQSLTGLWFEGQKYECAFVENPVWDDSLPLWENVKTALEAYFQGEGDVVSTVPIAFVGGDILPESRVGRVNRNPLSNRVDI